MYIFLNESGVHKQQGNSSIALIYISVENVEAFKTNERKLKKALRDAGISIKKLKTVNNSGYSALRVADAIAGIVRYYDENPDNQKILL